MTKSGFSQEKIISKIEEELRRHTSILKEDFEKQVKTIAEQYESISRKLTEHDLEFLKIHEKLKEHDLKFIKIDERFNKLEKQFGAILTDHEHRLKRIEQKF